MASTDAGLESTQADDNAEQEILDQDLLARQIFYATSFENDAVSANALLQFRGDRNGDGSFDESLFLLRLTNGGQINSAGCQAAAIQNERQKAKRESKGLQPPEPQPGVDRRYYCGYTAAAARDLRLNGANYNVELKHSPEDDMDSHVAIYLRPASDAKLHAADRTEAGRLLALAFKDPEPHICDVDAGDAHHPVMKFGAEILKVTAA